MGERCAAFLAATPAWPVGRETEMNLFVGFRAVFEAPEHAGAVVRIAAATVYRAFLNGTFLGYGPARAPRGWCRVDEWDLTGRLRPGRNLLAVEVAGYNATSYYLPAGPSFLQAEVLCGREALAATGSGRRGTAAFEAILLPERIQKVERYSYQRPFSEVYRLTSSHGAWRSDPDAPRKPVACSERGALRLLPRRTPLPDFHRRQPVWEVARGTLERKETVASLRRGPGMRKVGATLSGFPEEDLTTVPSIELQHYVTASREALDRPAGGDLRVELGPYGWHILDLGANLTGFVGARVRCTAPTRLFFTFDELLSDQGDVDFLRLGCVNCIAWELPVGVYDVEAFEPYNMRYLKIIALDGACTLEGVFLREYAYSVAGLAQWACSDERLNAVFAAARETFRQNTLDVFMDCPSRERAGWLCDSFFTARAAADLCGETAVERAFFENFLLPESFESLPDGMLPMCWPADHPDGTFIPNWAMWFVLQLEEYLRRSGDRETVDALRPKVLRLLDYFDRFRNEDGLLERLESWVFVEWSKANRFVQDVNYPSNMLYAATLAAADRLYALPERAAEAERIRRTVRAQSFDGEFFVDNAVREAGRLRPTHNRTETCQYYAFYFDLASPETHPELWRRLCEEFGPQRGQTGAWPEIHPSNAFIGNVLRIEVLSRYGRGRQAVDELVDFYLPMAERTGTLWEHMGPTASCNHGFASHVAHVLVREALGLREVDRVKRRATLCPGAAALDWCAGTLPTPEGPIRLEWRRRAGAMEYRFDAPAGWAATDSPAAGSSACRVP